MHQLGWGGEKVDYAYMVAYFSPVWIKSLYAVALAAIAFHFGNGLYNFAFKWGIVVSAKAQRSMMAVSAAVCLVLFDAGNDILFAYK